MRRPKGFLASLLWMFFGISLTLIVIYFNFLSEIFNQHQGWVTIISIFAALFSAYVFYNLEKEDRSKKDIVEQLKIIEGLIAELEILSSTESVSYFNPTEGNLNWYKKELEKETPKNLDHSINSLNFNNYITSLDKNICQNIDFLKLVRSLSYMNDKISQINTSVIEINKANKNYTLKRALDIVKEAISCTNRLKEVLNKQKNVLIQILRWHYSN